MTETPKSPTLVTLWTIALVSAAACFFLAIFVNHERGTIHPDIDTIVALGAWADIFMIVAVVSGVGAMVLNGVIRVLVSMTETQRLQEHS